MTDVKLTPERVRELRDWCVPVPPRTDRKQRQPTQCWELLTAVCDHYLATAQGQAQEGGLLPDFSCDDNGAFVVEWYIDNRNVLAVSHEADSLHAAWMVDGIGGSCAWELGTATPNAVADAYAALAASQRKEPT